MAKIFSIRATRANCFGLAPNIARKLRDKVPLGDIQLRRKPSHAQRGISSQTLGSTAHDWVRLARVQVAKQKTLDAREPRGAVRSFHWHFFQQRQVARFEKITQLDLLIREV